MDNFNQLKCPSCGAVLSLSIPDQSVVECPYCHQQVVNTYAKRHIIIGSGGSGEGPHILEFRLIEKDVIELLVNELVNDQCVPTDIFDKMRITSIKQYYIPIFIFKGTFNAAWTSEIQRDVKRQRINREGKVEDYYETLYEPRNGEAVGNFTFNSMPLKELNDLGLDIKQLQRLSINVASLPTFSTIEINNKDIEIIPPSGNSKSVWWESGESGGVEIGRDAAWRQAPGLLTSCSASCELRETSFVYIPLWIVEYQYEGLLYLLHSYAESIINVSRPKGEEIEAEPTEEQKLSINKYSKIGGKFEKSQGKGCIGAIIANVILLIGYGIFDMTFLNIFGRDTFWIYIGIGIAIEILIFVMTYIFKKIYGIKKIEMDIYNRTKILKEKAYLYRKDTGLQFLRSFEKSATTYKSNRQDIESPQKHSDTLSTPITESHIKDKKTCCKCGKVIDINHFFCRYCGAKQE